MFTNSTQMKYWMFKNENELMNMKQKKHEEYVKMRKAEDPKKPYFNFKQELLISTHFERKLFEFCRKFQPPMPNYVIGTSLQYFKRFYINNSVMEYHPMLIIATSAYLACKVEEFNVSIEQFLSNVNGNKDRAAEIVLNHELLLMKELNFHLKIHNPYRPVEGILIDVKTRCKDIQNVDELRPEIENFLDQMCLSNAAFIYSPSQIALAAVIHAASLNQQKLDDYVMNTLIGPSSDKLKTVVGAIKIIRLMYKHIPSLNTDVLPHLEQLEQCRNPINNPDSEIYKRKMQEMLEDEDERNPKYMKMDL